MERSDGERTSPLADESVETAVKDERSSTATPGWYQQPDGSQRYWDGQFWDAQPPVPPPPAQAGPPPPPPPPSQSPVAGAQSVLSGQPGVFWLAALSALLLIVGGFGPWATALNLVNVSGTHGDGWFAIGLGVFALVMLWLRAQRGTRGPVWWLVAAGVGGAILGFADRADIASKGSGDLFGEHVTLVKPAWGIYMVIVASIALAVLGFVLARSYEPAD